MYLIPGGSSVMWLRSSIQRASITRNPRDAGGEVITGEIIVVSGDSNFISERHHCTFRYVSTSIEMSRRLLDLTRGEHYVKRYVTLTALGAGELAITSIDLELDGVTDDRFYVDIIT